MKTFILALIGCGCALAQYNSSPSGAVIVQTSPSGHSCTTATAKARIYNGTIYTCQAGTYAAVSGGSGGGTWGSITGTLSNQTDLSTALAAKLDSTSTAVPMWHKYTVTHSALTAAATTQQITLFTLPANGKIQGVTIKHSIAFAGTSITAVTVSLGSASSPTGYAPAFNVFQAVSSTAKYDDGGNFSLDSASHAVVAQFTSTGANLSALTAGSVDVWVLWSVLP